MSDHNVVDGAEGTFMDDIGLTEEQACQLLQKLAMGRRQRLADAAQRVVAARSLLRPEV